MADASASPPTFAEADVMWLIALNGPIKARVSVEYTVRGMDVYSHGL